MKKRISTIIPILIFFVGLSILLYPTISNLWNKHAQSNVVNDYEKIVAEIPEEDYEKYLNEADAYNQALFAQKEPFIDYKKLPFDYENILKVDTNGTLAVLEIDKIDLRLPIYHGISSETLDVSAGHFTGSSLPVGGPNTHAVLSAHTGLPSAKLFSDIDELEIGDKFTIKALNRLMTYQVDQIKVVLPNEMEYLRIEEGKDYVTLLTCTPYGVNTHRLLVRAERVPNGEPPVTKYDHQGLEWDKIILAILAVVLTIIIFLYFRRKRHRKEQKNECEQKINVCSHF